MADFGRLHLRSFGGLVVVVAVAAASMILAASSAGAQPGTPTVRTDRANAALGETITVTGEGWEPGQLVQVETCGNLGLNGSIDCAVAAGVSVIVGADGSWVTSLIVAVPPRACPCVVSARPIQGAETATTELTIAGAAQAAPTTDEDPAATAGDGLVVTEASIIGRGPPLSWFGAAPDRELVLTVLNAGTRPMREVPIDIAVGRHPNPGDRETATVIETLEPGELRTVRVPLTIRAPAGGSYRVDGLVAGSVPFESRTRVVPWGLLAVVIVGGAAVTVFLISRRGGSSDT